MKDEDIFIKVEGYKLPKPLSKEETRELFKSSKLDEESRNKIIEHNIKLVLYEIKTKFYNFDYDKKELVSVGIFGLINAVNTYDSSKGYEFTTYAIKCIDNEIFKYIRKLKKTINDFSFEKIMVRDDDSHDNIKLEDSLTDETDFREEIEKKEVLNYLKSLINGLSERDRKVIMMYFGFYDDRCYTEEEIANVIKKSRSYVSTIIINIVKKFRIILERKGLIELHSNEYIKVMKK